MIRGKYTLVMIGPPIFICENNRKSNKIMHCVEEKKFGVVVLKIGPFFTFLNLVMMGGSYVPITDR